MRYKKEKILTADVCLKLFFKAVKETANLLTKVLKKIFKSLGHEINRVKVNLRGHCI